MPGQRGKVSVATNAAPSPARVSVGVGSNIDPLRAIASGLDQLEAAFGPLEVSPAYHSAAIGFDGPPFINLVVRFSTRRGPAEVAARLRRIEYAHGRAPDTTKFSSRRLDLDLLLHGKVCNDDLALPRPDILDYAYILWPLADIAGSELHPGLGLSYDELRAAFPHAQSLRRIAFAWRSAANHRTTDA